MANFWIVVLVAVIAVALLVLGLSITLLRKGRDLESDVGSNRAMRERGIECTSAQIRREEAIRTGRNYSGSGCDGACEGCADSIVGCK